MGVLSFSAFANQITNRLWLLGLEPEVALTDASARWSHGVYVVEVQAVDASHARVLISSHGELHHTSEPGPQTDDGARRLADGFAALWMPSDEP
jgi:hypothetical protein